MKDSVKTPLCLLGITSGVFASVMALMWGILGATHLVMQLGFMPYKNQHMTMDDLHDFINAQWFLGMIWSAFVLFYGIRIIVALLRK